MLEDSDRGLGQAQMEQKGSLWEAVEEGHLEELVSQSRTKKQVGSQDHRKPPPSHRVLI